MFRILMKITDYKLQGIFIFILIMPIFALAQTTSPPEPYGGKRLMKEFFSEEMVYPESAKKQGIEGNVELSFNITKEGKVSDVKVEKSVTEEIDAEAIRLIKKICWHPATEIGKPVAYRETMEIPFKLRRYENWVKQRGYDRYGYPYEPVDSSQIVFVRAETDQFPKPRFNSIDKNLVNFLSQNLTYPEAAFKGNVSGTVKLRFVVEPSGRISNIQTIEGVGGGCTEEAIRVVKMIRWYPGLKDKIAVRTCMPLEITFDISKKTVAGTIPNPGQLY